MFTQFIQIGFQHILEGYDHLLFLTALVLVSRKWQDLLSVISAFTIAHTTTIVLCVFGVLSLPSLLTESLIAASIAYAGFENIFRKNFNKRWMIAGAFGLVHGAGFSGHLVSVLQPLLGTGQVWGPIFGFTFGVELGQLAVITLIYPAVMLARYFNRELAFVRAFSAIIAIAGTTLFILRLSGSSL
jgi:hydrogenase/urease accessory protein HupE